MNDLHRLIKSMSKSEKRYFRLFASSFSNENSEYLKLFSEIDLMEEYDEQRLKKKLKIKHLSVAKKYLKDVILKALRLYNTEQRQGFQMLDAFKNIAILRDKGLIKEAIKLLEKTEEQLLEFNLYPFLLELLNIAEVLYRLYLPNKEVESKLNEIEGKKLRYLDVYENITAYQLLSQNLRNVWRKVYPIRNKEQEQVVAEVLQNSLLTSPEQALTSISESYFYNSMILCHTILLNFEEVKKYAEASIIKIQKEKTKSFVNWKALMANTSNLLVACAKTKDHQRFEKYNQLFVDNLAEMKKKKLGTQTEVINQKLYYNYTLLYFHESELYDKVINCEPHVEHFWKTFDEFLDNDWKVTVSYFLAQAFFQNNEFEKSIKWIDFILNEEKNNPKTPSVCNARILNLLVHFKQQNYYLLESLMRSTYRFLNKNERLFKSERLLLNYFKWISENPHLEPFEEKTNKLFTSLEEISLENKYEHNFYNEMKPSLLKTFDK